MKQAYDLHTVHNTTLQKRKKKSINHRAIISINYRTLVPTFIAPYPRRQKVSNSTEILSVVKLLDADRKCSDTNRLCCQTFGLNAPASRYEISCRAAVKDKQTSSYYFNPLNTKRRPLYLKTQSVPRCKHFSFRL